MDSREEEAFVTLVRLGIGHSLSELPQNVDWTQIQALAARQGLSAIILDGIERLPEGQRPPQLMLLTWIGQVLQDYEGRYAAYRKAVAELAAFYNAHGYKMMLLKGFACGMDWPKPEHRPYGDIDIWLFGKQKEADAVLEAEKPVQVVQGVQEFKIDHSHHHHTVFNWQGFTVENHYDFVNVHHHKSNVELEKTLKELANDDTHYIEINGERVFIPTPNFHALFLLRHAMNHFAASELSFRQLLDWAFFVKEHEKEIDWDWFFKALEHYKITEMFNVFNAICVKELGVDAGVFHGVQYNQELKERVLEDILNPAYGTVEPSQFIRRLVYKFRRWQGNAWKQRLCYPDSRWSAFWCGVWSHILKPSSI